MPADRRHARILAMQALCQWEVHQDDSPDALADFLSTMASELHAEGAVRYASQVVRDYWPQAERVDAMIGDASTKWDVPRMSPVDRCTMRIAVVEMLGTIVPPKVALNEAIEIGRDYGGADSPRFINGVLDKVLEGIQKDDV